MPVELSHDQHVSERDNGLGPAIDCRRRGDQVAIRTGQPTQALLALTSWAVGRGEDLPALTVTRPSLEDVYLRITDDAENPGETHQEQS